MDTFDLWCWRKHLRVPWTAGRSNQSILKEVSPEYSLEGLMLKLKLPIIWPPDAKNWLTGKDPDVGKDGRQEKKGMPEDEMVGWHHRLNGRELEQAPGVGDGQGGLSCCSPWCRKESDMTELLNWTDFIWFSGSVQAWILALQLCKVQRSRMVYWVRTRLCSLISCIPVLAPLPANCVTWGKFL